jgi:hypothetical protein
VKNKKLVSRPNPDPTHNISAAAAYINQSKSKFIRRVLEICHPHKPTHTKPPQCTRSLVGADPTARSASAPPAPGGTRLVGDPGHALRRERGPGRPRASRDHQARRNNNILGRQPWPCQPTRHVHRPAFPALLPQRGPPALRATWGGLGQSAHACPKTSCCCCCCRRTGASRTSIPYS